MAPNVLNNLNVLKQWRFQVEDEIRRPLDFWNLESHSRTTTLDSVYRTPKIGVKTHELLKDFLCDECFIVTWRDFGVTTGVGAIFFSSSLDVGWLLSGLQWKATLLRQDLLQGDGFHMFFSGNFTGDSTSTWCRRTGKGITESRWFWDLSGCGSEKATHLETKQKDTLHVGSIPKIAPHTQSIPSIPFLVPGSKYLPFQPSKDYKANDGPWFVCVADSEGLGRWTPGWMLLRGSRQEVEGWSSTSDEDGGNTPAPSWLRKVPYPLTSMLWISRDPLASLRWLIRP